MRTLNLARRMAVLAKLGEYLHEFDDRLQAHVKRSSVANEWFTEDSTAYAISQIAEHYLRPELLSGWIRNYNVSDRTARATVGIVAAGNVPLVVFHDALCVFASGNIAQVKLSDRDPYLMPFIVKKLTEIEPAVSDYFEFVEKLSGFDAIIATGSNNTARYFEQYFGKYPHIIRKNRNAVGILTGGETEEELLAFGDDVFRYFGLGCRNVSQVLIPGGYDFAPLQRALEKHASIMQHKKYRNNIDYHLALKILNKEPHMQWDGIVLTESDMIVSPVGCLHYYYYSDVDEVISYCRQNTEAIQCVVSAEEIKGLSTVRPGHAQQPRLDDYADGVDVMQFLTTLEPR